MSIAYRNPFLEGAIAFGLVFYVFFEPSWDNFVSYNMDTLTILTIVLFLVGAVQGVVFGGILVRSTQHNKTANRFLATILFLLSYRLLVQTMRLFDLGYYDTWYYFMLDLSWVSGPLLYFYVQALITPNFRLQRQDWIHFLPLLIQVGFSIFVRLQNLYWDGTRESLTWLGYWGYAVWMNYSTIYVIASILIIIYSRKAQTLLKNQSRSIEIDPQRIAWIKRILLSFKIYFSLVLVVLLVDLLVYNVTVGFDYLYFTRFYYYPFFSGISVLTYWIGIEGFLRKDRKGLSLKPVLTPTKKRQLEEIAQGLRRSMEERHLYRNPELNLSSLAKELGVKPYLLTQALNEILDLKFNDFVNAYRVAEVKELLADAQNDRYTLLSLALQAGFNSKSSFNRAVKKHLGMSPSELKP